MQRSISRASNGVGNSHRHSFSASFGLPTGINASEPEVSPQEKQTSEVPISRLAYLNKPEIPVLVAGSIAAIINGVIFPIFGILISRVIKAFFEPPHELRKDSKFWAIIFMIIGIVSFLACVTQLYLFSVAGAKLIQRIRSMCFEKVVHMEVGWFDEVEHSSGTIGARLSADASILRALVGDTLAQTVQNIASAVAGLVIAFSASWQLAFIILVLIPLIGINGYVQVKFMKGFSADAKVCFSLVHEFQNQK